MFELLQKFENLIVLRTMMDMIDRNFIDTVNLQQVANIADECNINLSYKVNLDSIYDSEYDELYNIYTEWFEEINNMYLDTKNGLLKLI